MKTEWNFADGETMMREKVEAREFDAVIGIVWTINSHFATDREQYITAKQALNILRGGTITTALGRENKKAKVWAKKKADYYILHIKIPKKRKREIEV